MKVGVLLFARMSSQRLPGKALLPVGDRPLLGRVLDRARCSQRAAEIVLATSRHRDDDRLAAFAEAEGLRCFRGDLDDVLGRAMKAVDWVGWDGFVRVCGDRVFLQPDDIDRAIVSLAHAPHGVAAELVTNIGETAPPPGLSVEALSRAALVRLEHAAVDPVDREHLTRYCYAHEEAFRIVRIPSPPDVPAGARYVVDTPDDLARARYVVSKCEIPAKASLPEITYHCDQWSRGADAQFVSGPPAHVP